MYPEINLVAQSGIVKWPSLKYNEKGSPEFRFVLAKSGAYPWSIPCCAIGHTAEKLAGDLDEGMPVLISAAELCYRKRDTKAGEVSRMEILVWHAEAGQPDLASVPQDQSFAEGEGIDQGDDHPNAPGGDERLPSQKGKPRPRYPKHLKQPWVASQLSEN